MCLHFDHLVAFAVKNCTSRAFAAVFRVMRDMLESNFPTNAGQIVLKSTVDLGARYPACLPHIIDLLKHLGSNQPGQLPDAITLGLVDAFDEMEISTMMPFMEHLIHFFTEATLYRYEFCQPRVISYHPPPVLRLVCSYRIYFYFICFFFLDDSSHCTKLFEREKKFELRSCSIGTISSFDTEPRLRGFSTR